MFECKYKLELEDSIVSAKYVYKSQKRTQDKVIAIMIPILMLCMVAMLVYDIVMKKPFIWDIVLLIALVVLEIMYLIVPIMLVRSQKKSFVQQKLGEMDYLHVKIDENLCVETLYKDDKEMAKNIHNLKLLTSYLEDNNRLILVFNKVEFVCLRKANITGDITKLKAHLQRVMSKSISKKK
ncbi:MAG: hypothetical protein E7351_00020 [Clostridiales bacterium]|nr:hypothetical protein [Clostridiales bacterium]